MRDIKTYEANYKTHSFEPTMVRIRAKKVVDFLNKFNAKNILEIGCGEDSLFNHYKNFKSFCVIEPAESFYKKALNDRKNNEKIEIYNDFLENKIELLANKKFDFIILSSLLHEVERPKILLKAIKKIAKKHCILHINVPNNQSLHLLWAHASGIFKLGDLTSSNVLLNQHSSFNLKSLKKLVKNNLEIKIMQCGSYFIKPFNSAKMQELIENNYIDSTLLAALENLAKFLPEFGSEIYINGKIK